MRILFILILNLIQSCLISSNSHFTSMQLKYYNKQNFEKKTCPSTFTWNFKQSWHDLFSNKNQIDSTTKINVKPNYSSVNSSKQNDPNRFSCVRDNSFWFSKNFPGSYKLRRFSVVTYLERMMIAVSFSTNRFFLKHLRELKLYCLIFNSDGQKRVRVYIFLS